MLKWYPPPSIWKMSEGKQVYLSAILMLMYYYSYRCSPTRGLQAQNTPVYKRINVDLRLSRKGNSFDPSIRLSKERNIRYHSPEEEIAMSPGKKFLDQKESKLMSLACWLWDYLRRCGGASGYFIVRYGTSIQIQCLTLNGLLASQRRHR